MAEALRSDRLTVLDAWPVMQWFRVKTPGGLAFHSLLARVWEGQSALCISRMNLGEIYYITAKDHGEATASALVRQLSAWSIEIVPVGDADIDAAAVLKGRYRISYAFAAVLSIRRKAPLATGDPEFKALASDGLLELHWMGA